MAKMFYDLSEAASKLGKSEDEVREMSARGEIQEFRDGEKLIFKVDQIDLLAGDDDHDAADMSSMIPLADTGMGTAMGGSDAGESVGLDLGESFTEAGTGADAGSRTGISVFDVDDTDEADPAAQTQVSDIGSGGLSIESLGSGSGLMDLTRESDDTSLGAEGLLDDIYGDDASGGGGFNETAEMGSADESGLFEGGHDDAGVGLDDASPAGVMVAAEPYDGTWSGITGGLMLGAIAALLIGMTVMIMTIVSGGAGGFVAQITGFMDGNVLIQMGILAGAAAVFAVIGMVLGKKG
ncbi:MAG: helix-turn-helix domain-containing protein [Phycisphaerales bacterium]